jgi:hypothetical protein
VIARALPPLLCACLLSACSSLVVQVDVLDRTYAEQAVGEAKLRMLNYEIARRGSAGLEKSLESLNNEFRAYMRKLADLYEQKSKEAGITGADRTNFVAASASLRVSVDNPNGTVAKRLEEAKSALRMQVPAVQAMVAKEQWPGTDPIPAQVRQALLGVQGIRDNFARALLNEIDIYKQQERNFNVASTPAVAAAREAAEREAHTILAGPTLAKSEYAYVVSSAPDLYWAKNFNRALGSAEMGNSDIVIKMNSQADFSVKGMRFDASTVAAVASKVTTQTLLLGIQMAGVPLPKLPTGSTNTGDGAKLADASGQLSADQEMLAKRKAKIDAWRVAVREMALSILAEESNLTAANWAQQKDTVASQLEAMFNAMQSTLKLDGLD